MYVPEISAIVGVFDVMTDSIKHLLRSVGITCIQYLGEGGKGEGKEGREGRGRGGEEGEGREGEKEEERAERERGGSERERD